MRFGSCREWPLDEASDGRRDGARRGRHRSGRRRHRLDAMGDERPGVAAQVVLQLRLHNERVGRRVPLTFGRLALHWAHGAHREARRRRRDGAHLPALRRRAVRRRGRGGRPRGRRLTRHHNGRRHQTDGSAAIARRRQPLEGRVVRQDGVRRARDGRGARARANGHADADAVLLAAHAASDALVHSAPAAHEELEERRPELAVQRRVDERVHRAVAVTCSASVHSTVPYRLS